MLKNFKNIDKLVYGRGSFEQLGDILMPVRKENNQFMVFIVDDYFQNKPLAEKIPNESMDMVFFIDASHEEPKTQQIDALRDEILREKGIPSGVVGIGGGSIMDIAKALSLMFTNEGSSSLYQGLNLINKPGIYHCGVPTISGTGAECSMTAVLTGPEKKLGLKCDWTVFNQLILDPELTASVPREHWFYTGMDCYIHCIEAEKGRKFNAFSRAYGEEALKLCREVFLGENGGKTPENDEKLMIASLMGGLSLTYSEVGICHALSYGLSYVLGIRHGIANCIAFNQLEDYYPEGVREFHQMIKQNHIDLSENFSNHWTDLQISRMAEVAYRLDHMWDHAIGADWKSKVSIEMIKDLYRRM